MIDIEIKYTQPKQERFERDENKSGRGNGRGRGRGGNGRGRGGRGGNRGGFQKGAAEKVNVADVKAFPSLG